MTAGYQMRSLRRIPDALLDSPHDLPVHVHCLHLQMRQNCERLEPEVPHSVG